MSIYSVCQVVVTLHVSYTVTHTKVYRYDNDSINQSAYNYYRNNLERKSKYLKPLLCKEGEGLASWFPWSKLLILVPECPIFPL